jgi:uncharacterized protein YndB with AHSA1/START domain
MNVTVRESVHIAAAPERVWDFTQDWSRRAEWDPAISSAEVVDGPERLVRARTRMGRLIVRYKQFDRPHRTSVAMSEESGRVLGGGSWEYVAEEGGTRFTQQNTLVADRIPPLLRSIVRWQLRRMTLKALENAKKLLEGA